MAQSTVYVHKDGECEVGKFGCNGTEPQSAASVNAALATAAAAPTQAEFNAAVALINQLRAALVANGIAV